MNGGTHTHTHTEICTYTIRNPAKFELRISSDDFACDTPSKLCTSSLLGITSINRTGSIWTANGEYRKSVQFDSVKSECACVCRQMTALTVGNAPIGRAEDGAGGPNVVQ